jgi:3-methyladenine DNA glycosylase AlkC
MTNLGQIMPKSAALPPSRPPMMFRSLKNEVPEESERESKMETEESKEKEIAEMELTQEELEKNERVKRLAEQSSFENAIGLPIEKNEVPSLPPSKEEANLDKMAQIANLSENEANETDNKIVDSEEVAQPETPLGIPQASRTSFSSLQIDGANFMEGAQQRTRQSSLTTTVSYTNKMRGRRWLSVTDTSIDQHQQVQPSDHSWEEMPEKASSRKVSGHE